MGPGRGGPQASSGIAVTTQAVYVVMGPRIFKLDPDTLKVLAQAELPRPEPPQKP